MTYQVFTYYDGWRFLIGEADSFRAAQVMLIEAAWKEIDAANSAGDFSVLQVNASKQEIRERVSYWQSDYPNMTDLYDGQPNVLNWITDGVVVKSKYVIRTQEKVVA